MVSQLLHMELGQISKYDLVREADAMGLSEKDTMKYFKSHNETIDRKTYFVYKKKVKQRKRDMVFYVAKNLPDVHITQIEAMQILKKKNFSALLATADPFEIAALTKTILEIERTISEYNGWTQKLSEETIKKFGPTETQEATVSITF